MELIGKYKSRSGMVGTRPGSYVVYKRDDKFTPFVVWWEATDGDRYHGDYCRTEEAAFNRFVARVRQDNGWEAGS